MRRISSVRSLEGDFLSFILRKLAEGTWDLIREPRLGAKLSFLLGATKRQQGNRVHASGSSQFNCKEPADGDNLLGREHKATEATLGWVPPFDPHGGVCAITSLGGSSELEKAPGSLLPVVK